MRKLTRRANRLISKKVYIGIILIILISGIYVDSRYIEPKWLKVRRVNFQTQDIQLIKPLKIMVLSDLHLGNYYHLKDLQRVVHQVNELKPDMIVFVGDLIDDNHGYLWEKETISILSQLKSTYGQYAVYGNHDHGGNGTRRYAKIMKESNFHLLKNAHKEIVLEGGSQLAIVGIDDVVLGKPNLKTAFEGIPQHTFKILLSHAPDVADYAKDYGTDLQISGHTHGGQVRLPYIGALFTPRYGKKYIKGFYEIEPNAMSLYVTSGIGTSQMPIRFLNLPEIVMITLKN